MHHITYTERQIYIYFLDALIVKYRESERITKLTNLEKKIKRDESPSFCNLSRNNASVMCQSA